MKGIAAIVLASSGLLLSCGGGGGDDGRITFDLVLFGLPDLGRQNGAYEGFAVVDGFPVSTGKFIVNAAVSPPAVTSPDGIRVYGTVARATFGPAYTGLGENFPFIQDATDFFITVEPEFDIDFRPSGNVIMTGRFVGKSATLGPAGTTVLGGPGLGNFAGATGSAVIVTPTTAGGPDESGVWFTTDATGATPSLTLPAPTGNWTYEGWVTDGTSTWSLGKFTDPASFDFDAQSAPTRGDDSAGFAAPGQDFVQPGGLPATPILDLANGQWRVEVTVEPVRDSSVAPFPLRIFDGPIPMTAVNPAHVVAQENPLMSKFIDLPRLGATTSPGQVAFSGIAPGDLGTAREGFYAAWAVVFGAPALVARFVVDGTQVTSPDGATVFGTTSAFTLSAANTGLGAAFPAVDQATELFLTQEIQGTAATVPSDRVVLAGLQAGNLTALTVAGQSAIGGRGIADFSLIAGVFVTQTLTNDADGIPPDDDRGVWFRTLISAVSPGLLVPILPAQWTYEGWVYNPTSGERWSTGRFTRIAVPDDDAMTWRGRGSANIGFTVPGQDFLTATAAIPIPAPIDFRAGWTVFVTLEPHPDNSLDPFFLRVLTGPLPNAALVPSAALANTSASFPTGLIEWQ